MAYENVKLVYAVMSGNIYMARLLKNNIISTSRRVATEEVLIAATEWFIGNKKKHIRIEPLDNGEVPHLFYTGDPEKAKRILAILDESEEA
ncbi:DUF7446 family protein [Listeria monocytogenes]|uniref:DUF7446 family protein n=1 Tax=Listeria monocytogenes TaxID=1639 RepID=UPI000737CD71|nr:hypothetical protein [Listeria monocytogenes]EAD2079576.1 hypothetical protein [Listeria monocytogenes]EAH1841812.1 hypothetical protein [Listeria monocytogenes]ECW2836835.1 hypothetical protein [Listeria monocytogenes]EGT2128134.1 hypothetical protein [Listeria monocytogenes]EIC0890907.1 hypothetical protein [Listeria monocytogenes]